MFKKYILSLLALSSCAHAIESSEVALLLGGGTALFTATTWATGRLAYGPSIVGSARARYAPESNVLNTFGWYAQNGYGWNAAYEEQLRGSLKNQAVQFHNMNRDKWGITVMFDLLQGQPAGTISSAYYNYPLMQYMHDLHWYIRRLRVICALRMHSEYNAVAALLQQLMYIRDLLRSDLDLNREEQMYAQARLAQPTQQVNGVAQAQEQAQTTIHIY
jgi:hypothetical protein